MFAKKNSVQRISPTSATLEQHVRRAVFQGAHIWGQSVDPQPVLPSPTDWGWSQMDDGSYGYYKTEHKINNSVRIKNIMDIAMIAAPLTRKAVI